jgi:hypothetical protein
MCDTWQCPSDQLPLPRIPLPPHAQEPLPTRCLAVGQRPWARIADTACTSSRAREAGRARCVATCYWSGARRYRRRIGEAAGRAAHNQTAQLVRPFSFFPAGSTPKLPWMLLFFTQKADSHPVLRGHVSPPHLLRPKLLHKSPQDPPSL